MKSNYNKNSDKNNYEAQVLKTNIREIKFLKTHANHPKTKSLEICLPDNKAQISGEKYKFNKTHISYTGEEIDKLKKAADEQGYKIKEHKIVSGRINGKYKAYIIVSIPKCGNVRGSGKIIFPLDSYDLLVVNKKPKKTALEIHFDSKKGIQKIEIIDKKYYVNFIKGQIKDIKRVIKRENLDYQNSNAHQANGVRDFLDKFNLDKDF